MVSRCAMIPSKSARFKRNHRRYRTSRHFKHKRTGLKTFWYDWPAKSDKPAGGKRSQRICQNHAGEAFETGSDRGVLPAQKRALSRHFLQNFPPMWIAGAAAGGAKIPSFLPRPRATRRARLELIRHTPRTSAPVEKLLCQPSKRSPKELRLGSGASPDPTFRLAPHNIEAEQALLGAILVNNDAFDRISDFLRPGAFFRGSSPADFRRRFAVNTRGKTCLADHLEDLPRRT